VYAHRCTHGGPPRPHLIVQCRLNNETEIETEEGMRIKVDVKGVLPKKLPTSTRDSTIAYAKFEW
jgi:hypothetical protein